MLPVMEVAQNPSDLHKYCGLAPGSRKVSGTKISYNPKLKTLMFKIFTQFLKAKRGEWSRIFAQDKAEYDKRCPAGKPERGTRKLKVHLTSKNIVMRKFMTNLWLVYRWQNGLSTTEPFAAKIGPQHSILQPFLETKEGIVPFKPV